MNELQIRNSLVISALRDAATIDFTRLVFKMEYNYINLYKQKGGEPPVKEGAIMGDFVLNLLAGFISSLMVAVIFYKLK